MSNEDNYDDSAVDHHDENNKNCSSTDYTDYLIFDSDDQAPGTKY
jgi:hypothetical protein